MRLLNVLQYISRSRYDGHQSGIRKYAYLAAGGLPQSVGLLDYLRYACYQYMLIFSAIAARHKICQQHDLVGLSPYSAVSSV